MSEQFTCKTCVMDRSAEEIVFTDTGCNFCDTARRNKPTGEITIPKGEKYDVLIGLSGGVDSSYTLHLAMQMGLRPMCFSVDNGWQHPDAQENIMKLVEGLKVPYYRYTIDLPAFIDLQSAFMKAGQKNLEIPTDHILMATTYEMANVYGIKTVLSGGNWATESIMPESWGYQPRDLVHIKDVYKKMTGRKLKGLPTCGLLKYNWYKWVKGIKILYPLDYVEYNRDEAIKLLQEKYDYKPYGEKHCESIFTWWFQNYYLFEKFGIDKRKAHLSSLIVSGQISRDEAMKELESNPVYPAIGLEGKVMRYKGRDYKEFKTDERLWNFLSLVVKWIRWVVQKVQFRGIKAKS